MSEIPESNPFASPEEGIVAEYSASAPNKERMLRWIGLTSLSGALLYATYLTPATLLFFGIVIFWESPEPIATFVFQIIPIAVACLITSVYGLIVGSLIGLAHGIAGFIYRWEAARLSRLAVWGVMLGLLVAISPPILYFNALEAFHWSIMLWMATLFVGAGIAGWRLNANIRRYLLLPLWNELPQAEM